MFHAFRRVSAHFAPAASVIAGVGGATNPKESRCAEGRRCNIVLAERHRVALCSWPISGGIERADPRVSSLMALFCHLKSAGYDGLEVSVGQFRDFYFQGVAISDAEIATRVRSVATEFGMGVLGTLHLVLDGETIPGLDWALDITADDFAARFREAIRSDKSMGARYITIQYSLPPRYQGTPLEWRSDEDFLKLTVDRMCALADIVWDEGLNVYFETHIDRVSEDPVFFLKALGAASARGYNLEVNGDLSHYIYRGFTKGPAIDGVLSLVHHMHVRMARVHGDLSSEVLDLEADLKQGGAAAAALSMAERVAASRLPRSGGLSSRTVCGETGPMCLVEDTISHDERMVPLMRRIAQKLDEAAAKAASFSE